MRKTGVVVNPYSAGGRAGKRWSGINDALTKRLGPLEVRFTDKRGHGIELARSLADSGCELVIGLGGDGTVNEVVNGLIEAGREACIGVLPFGTGGDFRRSLGISRNLEEAIHLLATGRPLEIDIGKVTYLAPDGRTRSRHFANMVSFGMGGDVAGRSRNFLTPLGGKIAFLYASVQGLATYRGKHIELTVDNRAPRSYKVLNVAVGNGCFHGGGMNVCPEAVVNDGLLEVTVIEDLGLLTLARDLSYLYDGNIFAHPKVHHFSAQTVRATSPELTRIEVDGEPLGALPVEITLLERRLKVLAP